jgi:hypothetical protein
MNATNRAEVAARWLAKWGEPIDCPALQRVATPAALEAIRIDFDDLRALEDLFNLLGKFRDDLRRFISEPRYGSSESLESRLRRLVEVRESGSGPAPIDPSFMISLHTVEALDEYLLSLQEPLRQRLSDFPEKYRSVNRRASDIGFGIVCEEIATWIRERHRDRRGELDRLVSWPNVIACLEWHGHDLSHLNSKPEAARDAARRAYPERYAATRVDEEVA